MKISEFRRELRREGYEMETTGGSHIRVTHPEMSEPIIMALTPSDHRAIANIRALIKRKRREQVETRARRMMMTGEA